MELFQGVPGEHAATLVRHADFDEVFNEIVNAIVSFMLAEFIFKPLETKLDFIKIIKFSLALHFLLYLYKCILSEFLYVLYSNF